MNIVLHKKSGGTPMDITQSIDGVEWSGDYTTVARKLVLDVLYPNTDTNQIVNVPDLGDIVAMYEDNKELFRGHVFFVDLDSKSQFAKITAYDALIYLTTSESSYNFKNMSPAEVTRKVCKDFFIQVGELATPNVRRNYVASQQTPYDIMMASYTHASSITGHKYMPRIENGLLCVIQKGTKLAPVKLAENLNLLGSVYNANLQAMVNKVVIFDDKKNKVGEVANQSDIDTYGLLQKSISSEEGKNNYDIANKMLRGIEKKAQVEALGNTEAITGNAVQVYDTVSGLTAKFFIDSDTHTWKQNVYQMNLDIEFKNLMDEKEVEMTADA